ncbi:PIG-L deacetylase family protein [Clostridium sp. DL1XJH146]
MDISKFFSPPDITNIKSALCIQPHPDDNEVGMGGIIASLVKKGCTIHYLTVTNGDLGLLDEAFTHESLATFRHDETIAAGKKLGVSEFHFLNYPDGSLESIPELAGKIAELIRTIKPEAIFCPDPWCTYEAHNDHIITGKAAAQAFINSSLIKYPRGTTTTPWQAGAIGYYFTAKPNTVIDITETFEDKFTALAEHKTQINDELLGLFKLYFQMRGEKLALNQPFSLGAGLKVLSPMHMHCFVEASEI